MRLVAEAVCRMQVLGFSGSATLRFGALVRECISWLAGMSCVDFAQASRFTISKGSGETGAMR